MLNIEKTLQSVRDLLDRLDKEGVEFALVESEYSDCVAGIRNPNKVYVFLECSIRPNGTFVWRDYDHHKGVCDFDEFRVRITACAKVRIRPCRSRWPSPYPTWKTRPTV